MSDSTDSEPAELPPRSHWKRIRLVGKWLFLVWGGFSLVCAIGLGGFLAYQVTYGNRDKIDTATNHDIRFVLNLCELGEKRIVKVVHSYISSRSLTGDHLDAYAIQISHVELAELTQVKPVFNSGWYRGDQLPEMVKRSVDFVGGWHHEIPWFPTQSELESSEIYVYHLSAYFRGSRPTAVELIFVRPRDRMVFYFGGKS